MKLLFALYKYFPFGGLQKDMLAIANACAERGHQVQLFCQSWSGEYPDNGNIETNVLLDKPSIWQSSSNHNKNARFAKQLQEAIARIQPDLVIGFNKIPGIDIYYAADTCFKAKLCEERPWPFRLIPRYRSFVKAERQLFSPRVKTHVMAIAQPAIDEYQYYYQTPKERFTLLPPGISKESINKTGKRTKQLHKELKLDNDKKIILMVGSGFRTKGVDRAVDALAALPERQKKITHLVIAGDDDKTRFNQQIYKQGLEKQIHFLGGRKDIPGLLKSADLLIHPARRENTGTVLLEAAVACLPVLSTENCGYSKYIAEHNLGRVVKTPLEQSALNNALNEMLEDQQLINIWRENGRAFSQEADIYSLPLRAVETIEQIGKKTGCL